MGRRKFLGGSAAAAVAALGGAAAGPALAQAQAPAAARWRMATMWPKTLDSLHGSAEALGKRISSLSGGSFDMRVYGAGELVPAPGVFDAVSNGTVECGHVLSSFFFGKNPAIAFDAGLAFGLNMRQQNAWMYYGGGLELVRSIFKPYGIVPIPCGNVGVQMGGWYRKEINTVEDLKGLRFRIGGLGGAILSKLGVVPQQIPAGEIYTSLERGTIDATEFVGPYDDERFGFQKVARYYYSPGWWEGSAQITLLVNLKAWEALGKNQQDLLDMACAEQMTAMIAKYDAKNPEALKRLVAGGAQLRSFPKPVMDACHKATEETMAELADKNPDFKRLLDAWRKFRDEQNLWFRVAEANLDNYRYGVSATPR
ncbi:MAG: TRAP transporter substrate-binding protein DctP [Rubrivivax sp.]|nr:TRAP transporter substrate-binding protein DctP [Rubrivivax sp.]